MDRIESLPASQYANAERHGRVTSGNSIVPEEGWFYTIISFAALRWQSVSESFNRSCCGKIKSLVLLVTLPCYMIVCPIRSSRRHHSNVTHAGIIYLYILLTCTIVFNLWEQQVREPSTSTSYKLLQNFEIVCMFVAILFLGYVNESTRGRVIYGNRERNLILYFKTGLYVFGVFSLVYAMLNLVNHIYCHNAQQILLNAVKVAYIAVHILFLNRFYQAKLPNDGHLLQIALAHILGTNLSLWIWTLCKEVYLPKEKNVKCMSEPIYLITTDKYFYPLFIEYLLLVASMIFELWANIQVTVRAGDWHARYYQQLMASESASEDLEQLPSSNRPTTEARRRRNFAPGLAVSLVLGLLFASVFIAFVLAAVGESGRSDIYQAFLIVNICLYCSQIIVCYILLVCRQSQRKNETRKHVNLDDALLYFGLAGIILWEGFHFYALFFSKNYTKLEFVHGMNAILEDIVQTVALVSARRYCSRNDNNAKMISNCALFLLATNFALWCQNSFYLQQYIENPGEHHPKVENLLEVFANILNPIIIFFRFHSATCSYHLWSIYDPDD